ncbi:MAG: GNAT family N-acetyltransferase [Aeromicrobium sp.]
MLFTSPDPAADPYYARILLDLQKSAYAVEARLLGDDRIPPMQATPVGIAAWRGNWVVAWDGVQLLGAIAWADRGQELEIDRLMVAPAAHRCGVASALLQRVIDSAGGRPIHSATGRDNPPGLGVYLKHGFQVVGDERIPPGIWITRLALTTA